MSFSIQKSYPTKCATSIARESLQNCHQNIKNQRELIGNEVSKTFVMCLETILEEISIYSLWNVTGKNMRRNKICYVLKDGTTLRYFDVPLSSPLRLPSRSIRPFPGRYAPITTHGGYGDLRALISWRAKTRDISYTILLSVVGTT